MTAGLFQNLGQGAVSEKCNLTRIFGRNSTASGIS